MVALIAIVIIVAVVLLGTNLSSLFNTVAHQRLTQVDHREASPRSTTWSTPSPSCRRTSRAGYTSGVDRPNGRRASTVRSAGRTYRAMAAPPC